MAATHTSTAPEILIHVVEEELMVAHAAEAIAQMAATLASKVGIASAQPLIDSAMQRESSEPTFLGKGMALPHARVAGLASAGVCIAHSVAGVAWQSEKAQLIIFLVVPEEQPELYLQLMSKLVRWRLRLSDTQLTQPTLPAQQWEADLQALFGVNR